MTLFLALRTVIIVLTDDGHSKKPKYVANYCTEEGMSLTIKLCRLSEKVLSMHVQMFKECN